jgi:hypothetical protein
MTCSPAPHELVAFAEDLLARAGFAVISAETYVLFESIERRLAIGAAVPIANFEAVLYAAYAAPYGDYHQAQVFA